MCPCSTNINFMYKNRSESKFRTVCWFLLEMAKAIPFFELNTGAKIPSVGLGTGGADPGAVADAVTAAIKVFYSCPKFF